MFVYADNAATTKVCQPALDAMMPYLMTKFGNPATLYSFGQEAAVAVEDARCRMAKVLHCRPDEIYFTAGGTEADNWMLKGVMGRVVVSAFEHHAALQPNKSAVQLPVYREGRVHPDDVRRELEKEKTALVSVMFANNEIGTIQPIAEIAAVCRERGVLFHTDAVQAVGHIPVDFAGLGLDGLSLSAHKFHGPKGVGALILRKGVGVRNLIDGGAQERNKRGGTLNVPGIVGMAAALEYSLQKDTAAIVRRRDRLIEGLKQIPQSRLSGEGDRLPSNVHFCFPGIEGESLLLLLDQEGICASSGSACTSGSLDPSHVLLAIGLDHATAHGSLRLTLSDETTDEEVDYMLAVIPRVVAYLRSMSPVWKEG
ncbi:MAG: aminotransferase class V-fold PLP-dependent enzyme [Oscillospiraceae bacterium]|nr:aminotransferase class V-fold PLP-dependent enzyme [Oscillospiraceae bacterium]